MSVVKKHLHIPIHGFYYFFPLLALVFYAPLFITKLSVALIVATVTQSIFEALVFLHILAIFSLIYVGTHMMMIVNDTLFVRLERDRLQSDKPRYWNKQEDFYEEYLLYQNLVEQFLICSQPVVAYTLSISSILFLRFIIPLAVSRSLAVQVNVAELFQTIWTLGYSLSLIFLFADCNADFDRLNDMFLKGYETNWGLIGGRDALLAYSEKNPIRLKLFGFPITYTWLISIVSILFTGLIGALSVSNTTVR